MKINSKENISFWEKLFNNESNYNKWAPYIKEFVQESASQYKCIGAVMTPSELTINDEVVELFYQWLRDKNVDF